MAAGPGRPTPAGTPAHDGRPGAFIARLDRWHAALLRLVGPNGRPVRKALLLAPALILFVGVPLILLSVAVDPSPSREAPPVTAGLVAGLVVVAPELETWLVIGLHHGASALARAALRGARYGGIAGLLGAMATGVAMAAPHAPHPLHRLIVCVFFVAQGLQYEAWRREYHFVFAYLALAATHCVNNSIAAGLLLLAHLLD